MNAFTGKMRLFISVFIYVMITSLFSFFFAWGFVQSRNQTYISLDNDSGSCQEVTKSIQGLYLSSSMVIGKETQDFIITRQYFNLNFITNNEHHHNLKIDKR
jgi:hypothetical protein